MADQRDGGIAWTDESWNPMRGCSRVSEGCRNCYAEKVAGRFSGPGQPYEGLARIRTVGDLTDPLSLVPSNVGAKREARWSGVVRLVPEHLADPLRWRRPRRVFVNSMSDLFHEALSDEDIAAVFGVMAAAPQHTFQVLTKRAERMRAWFAEARRQGSPRWCVGAAAATGALACRWHAAADLVDPTRWPLPNVWLGVSVEDQQRADERIPHLLATPAAVRWVSAEPLLGPVDFSPFMPCPRCFNTGSVPVEGGGSTCGRCLEWTNGNPTKPPYLDWIVVGGESGNGARPFDLAWARETVRQCREAGVAAFFKQGGTSNRCAHDAKGGHLECLPDDLRIREWPHGNA